MQEKISPQEFPKEIDIIEEEEKEKEKTEKEKEKEKIIPPEEFPPLETEFPEEKLPLG